jgi:putative transposase
MPYPASPALPITERQFKVLRSHLNKATVPKRDAFRIHIILNGGEGMSNVRSAQLLNTDVEPLKKWRARWEAAHAELLVFEKGLGGIAPTDNQLLKRMLTILADGQRAGRKAAITVEQKQQIVALACDKPGDYGLPHTKWTNELLRQKAIEKGIVQSISADYIGVILKKKH